MPSLRYATESFGDQWEFNALVDYVKKWNDDKKLEAGVKMIVRDDLDGFNRTNTDINTGISALDPLSINEFLYSEDIFAAYANYGFKKGPWGSSLAYELNRLI